jgi:hypothetical protein
MPRGVQKVLGKLKQVCFVTAQSVTPGPFDSFLYFVAYSAEYITFHVSDTILTSGLRTGSDTMY